MVYSSEVKRKCATRRMALDLVRQYADYLVAQHPEIKDLYLTKNDVMEKIDSPDRDLEYMRSDMVGRTTAEIGEVYLGDMTSSFHVRRVAVQEALKILLPEEERRKEAMYRRRLQGCLLPSELKAAGGRKGGKKSIQLYGCPLDDNARKNSFRRREENIARMTGVERENYHKMVAESSGKISWSSGDILFLSLLTDADFYPEARYETGRFRGRLNYIFLTDRMKAMSGKDRSKASVGAKITELSRLQRG